MIPEIRFYHLTQSRLETALPQLLARTLAKGWKAVVKASSGERVDALNQMLWTYEDGSFLPHGSAKDGDGPMHPVWLTEGDDNPASAQVLFLVDGAICDKPEGYELICTLFDGNDPEALDAARRDWKSWQGKADKITYWQQSENGWQQKA